MEKKFETVFLNGYKAPALAERLPISYFELSRRMMPARSFSFSDPIDQTNAKTFFIRVEGRHIAFRFLRYPDTHGSRPVMMLLHGMGLHIASFHGVGASIMRTHDLLLVDYNSYTQPEGWPPGGMSLRELTHSTMRVPEALGISRLAIGGSSLGGGMCLMAALDFPERVSELVLFNPAYYPQELPTFYRILRVPILGELVIAAMKPEQLVCGITMVGYHHPEMIQADLVSIYRRNMEPLANRFRLMDAVRHLPTRYAQVRDYLDRADAIRQRVLIIWGKLDELLAPETSEKLKSDLPNLRYCEFPELSHLPHEEAPDAVGMVVGRFLAETVRGS